MRMTWSSKIFLCAVLGSLPLLAEARVFNFSNERFAPYLRGQYQFSSMKQAPFGDSSGAGNTFDQEYKTQNNYEFGFVYSVDQVSLRFGFEVQKPTRLKDIKGSNAAGSALYEMDSDISGYAPKIAIDINVKQWPTARIFLNAGYGMATMTLQNSYGFTTAGQAAYPALANFREEYKGNGQLMEYSAGFEFLAFDTTTIVIDGGYRYLKIDSFTHNADVTNFQGAVTKGAEALDNSGGKRAVDFSGYFASVALRFWIF